MKTLMTMALVAVMGISANAQNKNAKHELHVKGNCGMCKERIEKAAYSVSGVKTADWNADSHTLRIILNEKKNDVAAVENAIVAVGHDTNDKKADEKVYQSLHTCCLYERDEDEGEHITEEKQQMMKKEDHSAHQH
ncbi:heavy-metal-associated domain-containing protein [Faecalibacter macacae]|uniref:Cation transporter n=1 Tax=Faecalibacter macacae TaxID=1859289 RepID=A0A3L9MHA1_9FLAO|nr:cation transporter [Faecalibacter macacae]RLZ12202.1 cation transporter [Faecalibacter macacae]